MTPCNTMRNKRVAPPKAAVLSRPGATTTLLTCRHTAMVLHAHVDGRRGRSWAGVKKPATGSVTLGSIDSSSGSLATYYHVSHPEAGRGMCMSSKGDLLLRYGFGPDISLISTRTGEVLCPLSRTTGNICYAGFSKDGKYVLASSDGGCPRGLAGWLWPS